jgi:thiosulfate dehydrogenase
MAKKSGGGGFGKLLLGFVLGILAVAGAGYAYLKIGNLPVAVTDAAFPLEKEIVKVPMQSRIERE